MGSMAVAAAAPVGDTSGEVANPTAISTAPSSNDS
jgi:hypothetical protein